MRSIFWLCALVTISFLVSSCTCGKKTESAASETSETSLAAEDDSPLGQFRKKLKRRKRQKRAVSTPPTREDGLAALEEARLLLEEADFRAAEAELKIAAAAGISKADEQLFRVRTEIEAEDRIIRAQKLISAGNHAAARGELEQVPSGVLLSDLSVQLLESLSSKESAERRSALKKAAERLGEPDEEPAGPGADEPSVPDEAPAADEKPAADEAAVPDETPKADEAASEDAAP